MNIYTQWAFANCSPNCNPDGTPCAVGLTTNSLPPVDITIGSYICNCQEFIATEYTKNQLSANPYYGKLLYNTKTIEKDGATKHIPLFRNINAKQSLSKNGNGFDFYSFTNKRYSGEVLADGTGTTLTVSDGDIRNMPAVSITVTYPNPADPCCPIEIVRKCDERSVVGTGVDAFGNPTSTIDIGIPTTDILEGSTVMLRFDCLDKCERYPGFNMEQKGKQYTSYIQDFGREICFDLDEINSCGFNQLNQTIATEMAGMNLMNLYQYKQQELYDFFNHQFIMAINTGMNFARGNKSGETRGIETAMNDARNNGVKNYYPLTAVSPKAIFSRMNREVMDRQKYSRNGNVNYLVGTTQEWYSRILNNQEFLRQATGCTPQACKSTNTVYVMQSLTIDTGMGTIEFAVDPYLEQKYAGRKYFRFLPMDSMLFMTNKYKTLTMDGRPVMMPQGLQTQEITSAIEWRYNCVACHSYGFGFSLIPLGLLNGQGFIIDLVN